MKNYTFHFEIQTLIEQFIQAFNDVVIKRYNKDKELIEGSDIDVKYIYAPKQRVMETLVNPAPGGITLPAIAVNIKSIGRDPSRLVNKINGFNVPYTQSTEFDVLRYLKHIPSPVPVNISLDMNIFTKYQADMDQIISNFLPYCDPYIIISWRMPIPENKENVFELRTEVLFNNDVSLSYPDSLQGNQTFRCTASCSFVIKGWLFKANEENVSRIFYIDSNFTTVDKKTNLPSSSFSFLKSLEEYNTDYKSVSAVPYFRTSDRWAASKSLSVENFLEFNFIGSYFLTINDLYLSATQPLSGFSEIDLFSNSPTLSGRYEPFFAVKIPKIYYEILNDKNLSLNLPVNLLDDYEGYIDIIAVNDAGYTTLKENYNSTQTNFISTLNISPETLALPSVSGIQIL